ncbi:type II secretion system protein GspD [methane-oxidizing endosymbiont of Gigantopelta aegis]|uniref:type II secretion system protein GspD n=1 Tax=methane-oxidizing endosymbiont of Gigantopelta aegis TaxID=2794938 RepID=UPI00247B091C|nr:secretin N-terminal domain-containing protein [methane-oxidizing endosymbiont of Gigantopelta aegis]
MATAPNIGEVKIIPDEPNNALIVVASAQDYAVVHRIIKKLDVMPLQVLIDATIVEVTLSDKLKYGIKWFLQHQNGGQHAASSGGFNLAQTASDIAVGAATGGFGYAFVSNSGDIRAVLEANASDNKTNVISAPSLMVLNNQEASIQVGKQVPILSSQSTNTNSTTNTGTVVTNTIQMRDTGITLTIKPRVNANGLVIMDIDQKRMM